jgi:AraC-like DNA-binding protein
MTSLLGPNASGSPLGYSFPHAARRGGRDRSEVRVVAAYALGGLTCTIERVSSSRRMSLQVSSSRHVFVCMLSGSRDEIVRESWNGRPSPPRRVCRTDESLLVPKGTQFHARYEGESDYRVLVCEIDDSAIGRVLGNGAGPFAFLPYSGRSPIETSFAQRIEALCLAPEDFPSGYGDALASVFVSDLVASLAATPSMLVPIERVGSRRFEHVIDFIEENLERNIRLIELASIAGLSVARFAHAFKAEHGLAPYRYILQRRIERSKRLLRTTDATIASVAARLGFSSQSKFSSMFARDVGAPPSAYRSERFSRSKFPHLSPGPYGESRILAHAAAPRGE